MIKINCIIDVITQDRVYSNDSFSTTLTSYFRKFFLTFKEKNYPNNIIVMIMLSLSIILISVIKIVNYITLNCVYSKILIR